MTLAGPASADVTAVTGSAFGYLLNVSLFGGPVNTRGPAPTVALAADASNSPQAATAATTDATVGPAQFFSSSQADVSTTATTGPTGSVTSTTNIANVDRGGQESFGYGPLDTTTLYPKNPSGLSTGISSTCTASDTGASGSTTISNGQLELDNGYDPLNNGTYAGGTGAHPPVRVIVPNNPAPNTTYNGHIEVNGSQDYWRYVFNEQVVNPDGSLTVYAGHEYLLGPTAVGDLYFGKVVCGVTVPQGTTTSVASSANPSVSGQTVSFTATVVPTNGPGTPSGSVQFTIDGANFGGPVTLAAGNATSASTSGLSVGTHAVQAIYSGDGVNLAGSTGTVTQTVSQATTTALASSARPSVFGQPVTFTARVAPVAGSGTPTGTVQFTDNGANLGGPVTLSAGRATSAPVSSLTVGSHSISAVYSGGGGFSGSTGTRTQTVKKAVTSTALASSKNPAGLVDQVTFTATVSAVAPGNGTPTGMVQFKNNGANLGSPVALSAGQATTTVSGLSLGLGTHPITAVFSHGTSFSGSTSAVLNQVIQ